VQLYEIAAMLLLLPVLIRARSKLRRPGSLFLLYIGAYSGIRFLEEFVREGAAVLGIRAVQWVMLLVAVTVLTWLVLRERKPGQVSASVKSGDTVQAQRLKGTKSSLRVLRVSVFPNRNQDPTPRDSLPRNATAVGVLLGIAFVGQSWFTRFGASMLTLVTLPPLIGVLVQLAIRATRGFTRRAAISAAMAALVFLGAASDSVARRDTMRANFLNFEAGAMTGEYTQSCGGTYRYGIGGLGASRTSRFNENQQVEYGIRAYGGPNGQVIEAGVNPYARFDTRWVGVGLGGHAVVTFPDTGRVRLEPSVMLRVGPVGRVFLETDVFDHTPAPLAGAGVFKLGLGYIFRNHDQLKVGISDAGLFVNPDIGLTPEVRLAPFGAFGGSQQWEVGFALRYSAPEARAVTMPY
jgi:hypothetical protein